MPRCQTSTHHQSKRKTLPFSKAKSSPVSDSADSPIYCRSKCKCFGTYILVDTVRCGTTQQTFYSYYSVDQASLSTTLHRLYIAWWWWYYALRTFSLVTLEPLAVVEYTIKAADYWSVITDQLPPYMASVFPNWKLNLPAGELPMPQSSNCIEEVEGHSDEFQLMS
ncbi:hypothetical protein TNCV_2531411 [Trichonephila clavipes]|nr:hypothetical protein TNCV_2531411 [Trichonephila clavipes]